VGKFVQIYIHTLALIYTVVNSFLENFGNLFIFL